MVNRPPSRGLRPHGITFHPDRHVLIVPHAIWNQLSPSIPVRDVTVREPQSPWKTAHYQLWEDEHEGIWLHTRDYPEVNRLLNRLGYENLPLVRIRMPSLRSPVLPAELTALDQEQLLLHHGLRESCFGQILVAHQRDVLPRIAEIARAFPAGRFVVPTTSRAHGQNWATQLRTLLNEDVEFLFGLRPQSATRVVVMTYAAARSMNEAEYGALLMPCPEYSLTDQLRRLLHSLELDRAYLIRPESFHLPARQAAEWSHRFGPVVNDLTPDNPRELTVSWVQFGSSRNSGRTEAGLGQDQQPRLNKRKFYWRHTQRNRLLAAVAREVCQTARCPPEPSIAVAAVTLLVETDEQACQMRRFLPDWPLITDGQLPPGTPAAGHIVTLAAAAESPGFLGSPIVYAGGGPPSPWLHDWMVTRFQQGQSVRLIDCTDEFGVEAARLAEQRRRRYREWKWRLRPLPKAWLKRAWRQLRAPRHAHGSLH